MVVDKRGGSPSGPGAGRVPRPVVTRPGSINRGFASVDPERQREAVAEAGDAPVEGGRKHEAASAPARERRAPASGGAGQPGAARRHRAQPGGEDEEGGSA